MKRHSGLYLSLIIVLAIAAGVFVYPKYFGAQYRPWQLGCDLAGGAHMVYQVDLSKVPATNRDSVVAGLRDVMENRVNFYGASEPQISTAQSGGNTQLIVDLCGIKNLSDAIQQIGATPVLDFRDVRQNGSSTVFIPTNLTGQYITGAQLTFDQMNNNAPQVSITFNDDGAKILQEMTTADVGKPLAIFLDNQFIEAPMVKEVIPDGKAVISGGNMTLDAAKRLVEQFNTVFPAPITLVSQQTFSASLGGDSLKKVIIAGIIGTILVILFMLSYYGLLGIFAACALIVYIVLTLGIFKVIPITMTLAGIAGFILTIGMAVDANILIFERIKEEHKRGLPYSSAIGEGFRRAWPSIRDSNTSTIITAIILYYFTSEFVRGFALTLLIGTLVSLFSAITTTRLFLRVFLREKKPGAKPIVANN